MIRQRPWFAAVVAFVTVLGIGGVAFGAQAVFDASPSTEVEIEAGRDPAATAPPTTDGTAAAKDDDTEVAGADVTVDKVTVDKGAADEDATDKEAVADDPVTEDTTEEDEVAKDATPPPLTILTPDDGATFDEKLITFTGETEAGATVAAGKYLADVDASGHWSMVLVLSPGANKASFTATDAAGNETTASIVVHLSVDPDKADDPAVAGDTAFTANQLYGSCEEQPPYDVFWGTATPGTKVIVSSKYGSAKAYPGESGEWEVKVPFPDAPSGKEFVVKVSSGDSVREFLFTSYAEPKPVEYSVSQIKASSDSPEPYAKFAGTAEAGTVIEAASEYGASSLVVEASGEWWLKVHFSGQPANQAFPVVVSGAGVVHEFSFIWYQGEG